MDVTATHPVNELLADEKRSLESLLGLSLEPDQHVLILTYKPGVLPDNCTRHAARERIAQTLLVNQRFAADEGVSTTEADAAVLEAMNHIRRRA